MQSIDCSAKDYCPIPDFAKRFIHRWDIYAVQREDGRYICIHKPLEMNQVLSHLIGDLTLGTYLLTTDSLANFIVLDADDEFGLEKILSLSRQLQKQNIPSYLENSRRGGHLWLFLSQAVSGMEARLFGSGLLSEHQIEDIELFPKQDKLSGGPGSLIRLPFGIHRVSGSRYDFFTSEGKSLAPTIIDQIRILSSPQTISTQVFEAYKSWALERMKEITQDIQTEKDDVLSERIKSSISVIDFISQFITLKSTANGAIGLCPFHDDHNPSFGINTEGNYWHCFAGCGGGSIIDFWMKWRNCDFNTAVVDLGQMLL